MTTFSTTVEILEAALAYAHDEVRIFPVCPPQSGRLSRIGPSRRQSSCEIQVWWGRGRAP